MVEMDRRLGWWDVQARDVWTCPKCGETSDVNEWREQETEYDTAISREARICPRCFEAFDHIRGPRAIEDASEAARPFHDF
jgi:ribosomal protein S27AE